MGSRSIQEVYQKRPAALQPAPEMEKAALTDGRGFLLWE